jgi:glyoxalase-like protein
MNVADRQRPPPGELYLDHVSHFVADLDAAARACEALGLKVTATSVQQTPEGPVGASNRCVMLEEGYIELLSPTQETPAANRMRELMRRYEGVHLVCFGTPDAEGEHRRLQTHGFEPQPLVDLARGVEGGTARFKVVRPAPDKMPEGRVQYVEHVTPAHVWRAPDVNPLRLGEVFVVAEDPVQTAARWARFAALLPEPHDGGVRLKTGRGSIFIATRAAMAKLLGKAPPAPAIAGYGLAGGHPDALSARCRKQGITVQKHGARYAAKLPAALGSVWLFG